MGRPRAQAGDALTPPQREILEMIVVGHRLCRSGHGLPPTVQDMATWMGYASKNAVDEHLRALEKKGYIRRDHGRSRAIEVLR